MGPKGEIEHWRTRTQHLSSIIEQLKRKDCRYILGIISWSLAIGSGVRIPATTSSPWALMRNSP